jgi:hypothetical protein
MHGGACGSGYPSDSDAAGGGGVAAAGRPAGDWNGRPLYRRLDMHHGVGWRSCYYGYTFELGLAPASGTAPGNRASGPGRSSRWGHTGPHPSSPIARALAAGRRGADSDVTVGQGTRAPAVVLCGHAIRLVPAAGSDGAGATAVVLSCGHVAGPGAGSRAAAVVLSCGHACAARSLVVASGPRRSSYRVGTSGDRARLGSGAAAVTLCGYGVGRSVDSLRAQAKARHGHDRC